MSGQSSVNLMGFAAGGMLTAIVSSLFSHTSDATGASNPVNSATLAITSLQTFLASQIGPRLDEPLIQAAKTLAQLHDVTDAKELASNFAWLCPNHLLWNPLVSNYYHGEESADHDLFYWNNDTQRTTAGLYSDFLSMTNDNPLLEPNKLTFCGIPLDLKNIQCDTYTLAGSCDHITPWESCYQSCLALGGQRQFVLVNRGHARSLVCPIDVEDTCYYTHTDIINNADDWLCEASQHDGSWWPHWRDWLSKRSGEKLPPDNRQSPILGPAPGRYVFE
ncbi:Polyhydroxyalkanoic acid synthase [gamma proteobacterium IMCC2047]|nr:Polyhydroxyalkanoic acid synthase [gamma proteobacterium IMCC2047]